MPEKPGLGAPRGLFRDFGKQAAQDEQDATALADGVQTVADPRFGAVFLSIVNRLSTLEAAARNARIAQLGAEKAASVLVVDNEEATKLISELTQQVSSLELKIAGLEGDLLSSEAEVGTATLTAKQANLANQALVVVTEFSRKSKEGFPSIEDEMRNTPLFVPLGISIQRLRIISQEV